MVAGANGADAPADRAMPPHLAFTRQSSPSGLGGDRAVADERALLASVIATRRGAAALSGRRCWR